MHATLAAAGLLLDAMVDVGAVLREARGGGRDGSGLGAVGGGVLGALEDAADVEAEVGDDGAVEDADHDSTGGGADAALEREQAEGGGSTSGDRRRQGGREFGELGDGSG